jgi:hypothetical protein
MAFALQCLQASKQAFVVSQQTKIGACEKSVLRVQGGLVNDAFSTPLYELVSRSFELAYLTFVI